MARTSVAEDRANRINGNPQSGAQETDLTTFTPEQHLAQVLASYDDSPDPRLAEITRALITHLHQFVSEVQLTRDEWFAGIEALTRTGHLCDDERQEFILMSDTLGVSMLVEMINHAAAPGSTEPTVFGPFHLDGAPKKAMGESIVLAPDPDDHVVKFWGRVVDLSGQPIDGAELDVWETASNGKYDVQDEDQPPMNMRGVFTTGPDGTYEFIGVRPVAYQVPGDGPAGALLFNNGRHNWRPSHLHVVVSAPGHKSVITHLFDASSDYLESDAVFGVRDSLVVDMSGDNCQYDFVLQPTATTEDPS